MKHLNDLGANFSSGQINKHNDYNIEFKSDYKVPSSCAVFGVMDEDGKVFNGSTVMDGISMMHDRSNGLGGGFAAYGIYPDFKDYYAFHMFFNNSLARKETESLFHKVFKIAYLDEISTKKNKNISNPPIITRYFLLPKREEIFDFDDLKELKKIESKDEDIWINLEQEFMADFISRFNFESKDSFIFSSGKNMGIFKGVGYPEDIGEFYKLEEYKGYLWTSHGRFPTNSAGWWGGAHPFGFLNWSVVHNGEISSYGTNKRFINDHGYKCSFSTDTEVITYLFDLLIRKHGISVFLINYILAAPLWSEIEILPDEVSSLLRSLRIIYSRALINGPFSIIVGNSNFMYALNDRIKLRPLVVAKKDSFTIVSSEEAAIRKVCPQPDAVWSPKGGEPVIIPLKNSKEFKEYQKSLQLRDNNCVEDSLNINNLFFNKVLSLV